jgi:hypothetical protein
MMIGEGGGPMIPHAFWDEISVFTDYLIPVSGGVDSTYVYQHFKERGLKFSLLWNNTGRSLITARNILAILFSEGYPFNITYSLDDQAMITNKSRKIMSRIITGEISYIKKSFPCCYYLKEKPYTQWLAQNTDHHTLIISGLASYEGMQRNIHLGVLRNRNTFLRFKKREQRWFAYPLRDCNTRISNQHMKDFLYARSLEVVRSGCFSCPIVALFEHAIEDDQARIDRSKKVYGVT